MLRHEPVSLRCNFTPSCGILGGVRNLTRAERKKAQKEFDVGDVVTWGQGSVAHRVIDVNPRGVVVDVTAMLAHDPLTPYWASQLPDGRWALLVLFDHNTQGPGPRCRFTERGVCSGPPEHTDMEPDRPRKT